jgi:hypothetical protein
LTPRQLEHASNGACLHEILACQDWILWVLSVTLLNSREWQIQRGMKRTVQVNVKMTQEDFNILRKAAERHWPDAVMTNSGIVLAFARIAARDVLARKK